MKYFFTILTIILWSNLFAQKRVKTLLGNKKFVWIADSSSTQLTFYYQPDSWASKRLNLVRDSLVMHIRSVETFVGINHYSPRIHVFIVEDRKQMKALTGFTTNGKADHRFNTISGILSDDTKTLFANHEFFHIIAANTWGWPNHWVNEGMAVYSDRKWNGYDFYPLTKYLIDKNRYIPLEGLLSEFKRQDASLSYPLLGSFVKYLDETYGKEVLVGVWKNGYKSLPYLTGKNLSSLEQDWLAKAKTADYGNMSY